MKNIGFIGAGNMAKAIIGGILKSELLKKEEVIASAKSDATIEKINSEFGIITTKDSSEVVKKSQIIVVAVKPDIYDEVLQEVNEYIDNEKIIVTIAAGKSIEDIENVIGSDKKIVRTMPNTPALVGEGMTALCPNKNINDEDLALVKGIFNSFGKSEIISENMIEAFIGASGSSPAYAFMFIEAIADAVVMAGMSREKAYKFTAQGILGAAKMVLDTDMHPGQLKDMVCSPGGATIEAVKTLEEENFRGSVIKGVCACINKSKEMSKE